MGERISCTCVLIITFLYKTVLVASQGRIVQNQMRNVCDRHWEVVYSHDEHGKATFGDKELLRQMSMRGGMVKAHLYMPDHILQLASEAVNKRIDDLCFQSLRGLSHNGTHIDREEPWLYFMVCTTGDVTERGVNHTSYFKVGIDWFVKEISATPEPIYTSYIDGSPAATSDILKLHEAAKHMSLSASMRDKPFMFPFDNVLLDEETGEVVGQNVNHMGQDYRENYVSFHRVPYWWISSWSNLGRRDNARWSIQGHKAYKHNDDHTSLDWYCDICWRQVYSHDSQGYATKGTVEELIDYIGKGHRVRVRVDERSQEVSNIRVKDGVVAAQLLGEVSTVGGFGPDRHNIEKDTRAKFTIVHTTGKVITHEYLIGTTNRKVNPPRRRDVEWMVDTRPWRVVLETSDPPPDSGSEVRGSAFDLQSAINEGASIRLSVVQDSSAGLFFTQANNLRVDLTTDTIYAQAMDHFSDKTSDQPGEYDFQAAIFHWYLLISSQGPMRMTSYYYGSNVFNYDESAPEANITWFANM